MQIRAAVSRNAGADFSVETLDMLDIQADEILVRVVATGLCHTDIAVRDQILPVPLPAVLGHEGAGLVEAIGADVQGLSVGDHVVLGFAACRQCPQCITGQPAYCREFTPSNFSGRRRDGTSCLHDQNGEVSSHFFGQSSFATHAIVAAKNAVKVTKDAPIELLGPLGCGIMTGAGAVFHALQLKQGESLLVTGGGPVGLSAVMAGVVRGADMILVSDPLPSRRAMAIDLGATHVIDPAAGELAEQVRAIVPAGVENVLDTSGIAPVIEAAVGALAVRGRLATVGVPRSADAAVSLNILQMLSLGIQISGVTEGNADPQTFLPQLVDLFLAGKFPIDRMISSYRLDQINEAIADQHAGRCVKAILTM